MSKFILTERDIMTIHEIIVSISTYMAEMLVHSIRAGNGRSVMPLLDFADQLRQLGMEEAADKLLNLRRQ